MMGNKFVTGMPDTLNVEGRTNFSSENVNRSFVQVDPSANVCAELDVVVVGTFEFDDDTLLSSLITRLDSLGDKALVMTARAMITSKAFSGKNKQNLSFF